MGTYPSNPSYLLSTGEQLGDYIKKNPQLVGKSVLDRWGPEIPFLPKVRRTENLPKEYHSSNAGYLDPLLRQSTTAPNPSRPKTRRETTQRRPPKIRRHQPQARNRRRPLQIRALRRLETPQRHPGPLHPQTARAIRPQQINNI